MMLFLELNKSDSCSVSRPAGLIGLAHSPQRVDSEVERKKMLLIYLLIRRWSLNTSTYDFERALEIFEWKIYSMRARSRQKTRSWHFYVACLYTPSFLINVFQVFLVCFMLLQMLHMMNESVPPCEDIRGFSCGAWINDHPLPSTRSIWNQKKQLEFTSKSKTVLLLLQYKINRQLKHFYMHFKHSPFGNAVSNIYINTDSMNIKSLNINIIDDNLIF